MRRQLCISIVLLATVAPTAARAGAVLVGADGGWGMGEAPATYRATTYEADLEGARFGVFGGLQLPLGDTVAVVPRARFAYWRSSSSDPGYGMGGGRPQGAVHVLLPSVDLGLRYRPGGFFVDAGPGLGILMLRGRAGSGTSEDTLTSTAPVLLGRLEVGHRIFEHWDASVVGGVGTAVGNYRRERGLDSLLIEVALAVTRGL